MLTEPDEKWIGRGNSVQPAGCDVSTSREDYDRIASGLPPMAEVAPDYKSTLPGQDQGDGTKHDGRRKWSVWSLSRSDLHPLDPGSSKLFPSAENHNGAMPKLHFQVCACAWLLCCLYCVCCVCAYACVVPMLCRAVPGCLLTMLHFQHELAEFELHDLRINGNGQHLWTTITPSGRAGT